MRGRYRLEWRGFRDFGFGDFEVGESMELNYSIRIVSGKWEMGMGYYTCMYMRKLVSMVILLYAMLYLEIGYLGAPLIKESLTSTILA